ncbi:TetR/AcrR family transcriptional regulator [Arthrobacter sp. GCM10027362]|uniref:TetR/AcrR family transcriptional regulator n=1 Tax=Arthrobacter sp. GCM10027362 TaxID=3273379 RepID=UPI0036449B94
MNGNGKIKKYGEGREALLAAVVHLVAEQGLDGFSYRRVADRAGVNNTLISHHFGSKEALLEAATEWAVSRSQQLTDFAANASVDEDFAQRLTQIVAEEPQLQLFQYQMILASGRSDQMRQMAARLYDSYLDNMLDMFERDGLPRDRDMARAVFAALDGLVLQQVTVATPGQIRASILKLGQLIRGWAAETSDQLPAARPAAAPSPSGQA